MVWKRDILIGHDDLREALNQIPNIWDELGRRGPCMHADEAITQMKNNAEMVFDWVTTQVISSKRAKLEFLKSSKDDPTEWFNRVEQFFEYQGTAKNQKVHMAAYHLEGEANQWWQWLQELWARFGPLDCEDFDKALSRIRQLGTLRDYQHEFEKLGNKVRGWTQKALLARQRWFLRPPPTKAPLALPQPTRVALTTPAGPIKHLSWEEMQRKRLLLLEGHAGNSICEDATDQTTLEDEHEGDVAKVQEPEITLHALTGWTVPRTMRMTATIGSLKVVVLIDSGSTNNFISDRLASTLRLPVVPMETFIVRVANGERLKCQGHYDKVWVELQGTEFFLTLFSLPLASLDLVLGIQWLEMLGSVENQNRRLQGVDMQTIQEMSLKEISKEIRRGHALFAIKNRVCNGC
ncbi:hypothetical protein I3843_03G132800 [Carya illinoinensis]|nr:hypothetical protein I3843_03G132800 [Carya illinoinensis]